MSDTNLLHTDARRRRVSGCCGAAGREHAVAVVQHTHRVCTPCDTRDARDLLLLLTTLCLLRSLLRLACAHNRKFDPRTEQVHVLRRQTCPQQHLAPRQCTGQTAASCARPTHTMLRPPSLQTHNTAGVQDPAGRQCVRHVLCARRQRHVQRHRCVRGWRQVVVSMSCSAAPRLHAHASLPAMATRLCGQV
jgi:hypothetical protein